MGIVFGSFILSDLVTNSIIYGRYLCTVISGNGGDLFCMSLRCTVFQVKSFFAFYSFVFLICSSL
jgi:hypothetical protein